MAVCTYCKNEMTSGASCTVDALHRLGIAWKLERARRACGDCGVAPGGLHHLGCDMQRCPLCGGQLISCCCRFDEDLLADDEDDDDCRDEVEARFDAIVEALSSRRRR